nr:aldolase [Nitrosomonas sp.]
MSGKTFDVDKNELIRQSFNQMDTVLQGADYTLAQKLALTCRILFDNGHDSGLAGQITARAEKTGTYLTQRL